MHPITPHLWFDKEAKEAAALYTSLFDNSRVVRSTTLHDTPSGSVDLVRIELAGQRFDLLSAGPLFKFTPAVSFLVACDTNEEVDTLWRKLSDGGTVMMELGSYPFSERYGWTADRYGVSWQVMRGNAAQKITPMLMFTGTNAGKAEEAARFYAGTFDRASVDRIDGSVVHFTIEGQHFAALDSDAAHGFTFNEAISFEVECETQNDIDRFWSKLSADPNAEQCGWLKDRYGLSWQIVPAAMGKMLATTDKEKLARVTQAFLKMKKFDIAKLEEAYAGA